jgi:Holliday junction DNA helicase RuvA
MIGQLTGKISHKTERFIILDVAGVGYKVFVSTEALKLLTAKSYQLPVVSFWTHLVVREGVLDLYGFVNKQELDFFELLIGISGIGPKSALAILSLAPPATLEKAIAAGDSSYLTKVSGIGRKSAEKIIVELRDKIGSLEIGGENLDSEGDAVEALQSLGYNLREAREALRQLPAEITDTGAKIKAALKLLSK